MTEGWLHLFLDTNLVVHELEIVEFYVNLTILEGSMTTSNVKSVKIMLDKVKLGKY